MNSSIVTASVHTNLIFFSISLGLKTFQSLKCIFIFQKDHVSNFLETQRVSVKKSTIPLDRQRFLIIKTLPIQRPCNIKMKINSTSRRQNNDIQCRTKDQPPFNWKDSAVNIEVITCLKVKKGWSGGCKNKETKGQEGDKEDSKCDPLFEEGWRWESSYQRIPPLPTPFGESFNCGTWAAMIQRICTTKHFIDLN